MKSILLFAPDLMMGTRIEVAAQRLGYHVENADAGTDFAKAIAESKPDLVILTFDRTGQTWERLAQAAHEAGCPFFAFGSHENAGAFKRARELGATEVVPNSRFNAELPQLIQKWAG